jgi:signal transduction histidine kinase
MQITIIRWIKEVGIYPCAIFKNNLNYVSSLLNKPNSFTIFIILWLKFSMRLTLPLFLAILTTLFCHGQSIPIRNYGLPQGLPSAEVYDVFQDSKGFIWFSTDNGVVKFDGHHVTVFNVSDSLPDPVVLETIEDSSGKIWFRSLSGRIAFYENDKIHPYKFNKQLSKVCEDYHLVSMAFDTLGNLWFSAFQVIGSIDAQGKLTTKKIDRTIVEYQTVGKSSVISWNIQGPLKVQTFLSIDNKLFPFKLTHDWEDPKTSHSVKRAIQWNNNLYISINNNIFKYDGKSVSRIYEGNAPIISLSKDNDNSLWVGFFNNGAIRFTKDFTNPWTLPVLIKNSITKIIQDDENGFWLSTLENGVYYIPNINMREYDLNSTSKIRTAISISDKTLIGETDGTLNVYDENTNQIFEKKFERGILTLFRNKNNGWLSTSRDLYITDNNFDKTERKQLGNYIDFTEDANGFVWGIESRWISKFDQFGNLIFNKDRRMPHRAILAIDTLLLIGLHTGLQVYDFDLNLIQTPVELKDFKISKLKQLNDTTIFIATIGNGFVISHIHLKHIKHYKSVAQNIYSIANDNQFFWLGTEMGILKLNIDSLLASTISYELITKRNGLVQDQTTLLSITESGNLIAFYTNQFTFIDKTQINFSNKNPKFYLQGAKINNNDIAYTTSLTLPYDSNNIQLNFGFISFNHQDIVIRYKLKSKADWTYSAERQINLYSLSPGLYTPEVQYSADKVNWHNVTLPSIEITQPWWQTLAFQLSLLAAISFLIYVVLNNRIILYKERNERMELLTKHQKLLIQKEIDTMEKERSRIAKELHDGVGPNLLATKLTVNRIFKTYQVDNTENIDDKFQLTFREIKSIIYDLTPPGLERNGLAAGIKGYIDWLSKSIETKITLTTSGKDITDIKIILPVFRILQELISNSLKHSNAANIFIELNCTNDLYTVSYKDNGTGFSKIKNQNGFGLHNIESRVLAINGELQFKDSDSGVSYTIKIPLIKDYSVSES